MYLVTQERQQLLDLPYMQQLRHPLWQQKRMEILQRDSWTCRKCGNTKANLQVNHQRYGRGALPWEIPNERLVTLCEDCHGRLSALQQRARDLIYGLSEEDLAAAIEALTATRESAPSASSEPIQAVLEICDQERERLTAGEYTTERSRALEAIDAIEDAIWMEIAP